MMAYLAEMWIFTGRISVDFDALLKKNTLSRNKDFRGGDARIPVFVVLYGFG